MFLWTQTHGRYSIGKWMEVHLISRFEEQPDIGNGDDDDQHDIGVDGGGGDKEEDDNDGGKDDGDGGDGNDDNLVDCKCIQHEGELDIED